LQREKTSDRLFKIRLVSNIYEKLLGLGELPDFYCIIETIFLATTIRNMLFLYLRRDYIL